MNETCVCSLHHGVEYEKLKAVNEQQFKKYAERIGADYQQLCRDPLVVLPEGLCAAWLKLPALHKLLGMYQRVIFFDGDLIIDGENMPNLFEIVPQEKVGAFFEGRVADRWPSLEKAMSDYGLKTNRGYDGEYANTGMLVLSSCHRDLFVWPEMAINNFYEQGLINARLFCSGHKIHPLGYQFNRMTLVDNLCGEDRRGSHVIHYAGLSDSDGGKTGIARAMEDDLRAWREKDDVLTRIHCEVSGGLGDVICTEPLLRHMIEDFYLDTRFRILISTKYPRVFDHFRWQNVKVTDDENWVKENWKDKGLPHVTLNSHRAGSPLALTVPYSEIHNQDFNGYCLTARLLPPERKTICYEVYIEDRQKLTSICDKAGLKQPWYSCIAVHAGTGWATKTFPSSWWFDVCERLVQAGRTPILFGKNVSREHSYVKFELPKGCIDLRDKLNLPTMFALIEACPALLSNDSAPVHAAGAFNNHIFMIQTTKRAELVLPFRQGRTGHKAMGLGIPIPDHHGVTPTYVGVVPICQHSDIPFGKSIMDFLPKPADVINQIITQTGS